MTDERRGSEFGLPAIAALAREAGHRLRGLVRVFGEPGLPRLTMFRLQVQKRAMLAHLAQLVAHADGVLEYPPFCYNA